MKSMKRQGNFLMALLAIVAILSIAVSASAQSSYATGTTEAAVLIGPSTGTLTLESIYAASDKAGAQIAIQSWNMAAAVSPSATATSGASIVYCDNASYALTNADVVAYVYADGTAEYNTISSATTTNVTLGTAISQAATTADRIYELATSGALPFDTAGAAVGTNKYAAFSGNVWRGLGPVRVAIDGTSNTVINVTTDR